MYQFCYLIIILRVKCKSQYQVCSPDVFSSDVCFCSFQSYNANRPLNTVFLLSPAEPHVMRKPPGAKQLRQRDTIQFIHRKSGGTLGSSTERYFSKMPSFWQDQSAFYGTFRNINKYFCKPTSNEHEGKLSVLICVEISVCGILYVLQPVLYTFL